LELVEDMAPIVVISPLDASLRVRFEPNQLDPSIVVFREKWDFFQDFLNQFKCSLTMGNRVLQCSPEMDKEC
jgi:hypothetical protein